MKFSIILALHLLYFIPLAVRADEITVAAAANLQFTLVDVISVFEQETGIKVRTVIGSSGKLTAQIENGAPFDVFMSADVDYPLRLFKGGMTIGAPQVYAYGVLVLWTFKDIDLSRGMAVLNDPAVKTIAIASPKAAPYGRQSVEAMERGHLYSANAFKLVYGESISQVNQFIVTQAADIGFTAKSVVMADNMSNKGKWVEVAQDMYQPLPQAAVILKHSGPREETVRKFTRFLFSPQAREIFKKYGYKLP